MPVWSYGDSHFNVDMGTPGDERLRDQRLSRDDAGGVYRKYFTDGRCVEPAGFRI